MENKKCPKCGSREIVKGKQGFQGKMYPLKSLTAIGGSEIISDICTDCGYILEMRVEKPAKFK